VTDDGRPDAELLTATARGDGSAFAVLVRRHIRAATFLAVQLLGDQDDAEDVVQDAFTIVHRDARRFDSTRPFPPWCFAIVRRLASNRRARDVRRARLTALWGRQVAESSPASEAATSARIDADVAQRALTDLPPMQRACFELVVMRDLPIEQVAAMYGISESTVRQHVFRARNALRTRLEGT
jgi:RNA polymerase sigma-70 factor, ECF subfamily